MDSTNALQIKTDLLRRISSINVVRKGGAATIPERNKVAIPIIAPGARGEAVAVLVSVNAKNKPRQRITTDVLASKMEILATIEFICMG